MKKIKKLLSIKNILLTLALFTLTACSTEHEQKVEVIEDQTYCTQEYNPVCANVKINGQTIEQTFPNTCSAGNNEIIHQGECYN